MCHGYASGYQLRENIESLPNYFHPIRDVAELRPNSVECIDAPDSLYPDWTVAELAIQELRQFEKTKQPFFLATGFYRPHLPWAVPKKYWDLYERKDIELADNPYLPEDGVGFTTMGDLERYGDVIEYPPIGNDDKALEMIHGYYASVSFTDHQVGRILKELERLELDNNTIIVLWGDHGWHCG